MSSLGDLLLSHAKKEKVSDPENNEVVSQLPGQIKTEKSPDPNDRPRNVWHVVEGPKVSSPDQNEQPIGVEQEKTDSPVDHARSKDTDEAEMIGLPKSENSQDNPLPNDPDHHSSEKRTATKEDQSLNDGDEVKPTDESLDSRSDKRHHGHRERSTERSSSSRHKHRRDRDRDHDRERERERDRDRSDRHRSRHRDRSRSKDRNDRRSDRRSDRDRHKSSRRHRQGSGHSDDEHDAHDDGRRSSRRDRHRSRSRSKASSRRRDRSRSNSLSPISKRNSRTILIQQLNPRVAAHDLEDFFSETGKVKEVRLIMDSKTRRHKGIAYIEFEDTGSVSRALALNGQDLFGAPMIIQSALNDRNRSSSDWQSSNSHTLNYASSHPSSRSNLPQNSYRIYVGSLHMNITEEMLRSVFEPFGTILRLELMKDRVTNLSRGYAFITFADAEDGKLAVSSLDGLELGGKPIKVSKSMDKSDRHVPIESMGSSRGGGSSYYADQEDPPERSRRGSRDVTASLFELAGHRTGH